MNALMPQPLVYDEWLTGFNAFCDGAQPDDSAPAQWQNGWWAALDAEARAAVESTIDYEEDCLDREFWRRGEW